MLYSALHEDRVVREFTVSYMYIRVRIHIHIYTCVSPGREGTALVTPSAREHLIHNVNLVRVENRGIREYTVRERIELLGVTKGGRQEREVRFKRRWDSPAYA